MTSNQLKAKEIAETKRANFAKEKENVRHNRASETAEQIGAASKALSSFKTMGSLGVGALHATGNDVAWYDLEPQLLSDAANISYGEALGANRPLIKQLSGYTQTNAEIYSATTSQIPGIMVLHWDATLGGENDSLASPVNAAAKNIYTWVRHANSGHTNYESADLMKYIIAMNMAWNYAAELVRVYGIVRKGTYARNWLIAPYLVKALGFDYDDLVDKMANFRMIINEFITRLNALAIPRDLPVFQRQMWMASNVFKDVDTDRSPVYAFVNNHYFVYTENTDANVYQIEAKQKLNVSTVDAIKVAINDILKGLFGSEDVGIMSGDILKAYGAENLFTSTLIDEDYMVSPYYNEEVLSQIESAICVGKIDIGSLCIWEHSNGAIVQGDQFEQTYSKYAPLIKYNGGTTFSQAENRARLRFTDAMAKTVNIHGTVSPGATMVATRLLPTVKWFSNVLYENPTIAYVNSCGTEVLTDMSVVVPYFNSQSVYSTLEFETDSYLFIVNGDSAVNAAAIDGIYCIASRFKHAPVIYFGYVVGITSDIASSFDNIQFLGDTREFSQWARVDDEALTNMHGVAILSEYGVPLLGNNKIKASSKFKK